MGNPFLFADRFSGAVVHLTADGLGNQAGRLAALLQKQLKQQNA